MDGIPPEIFAAGGPTLVKRLLELYTIYSAMWKQEKLPQEYKNTFTTHLYKNKGNRQACDNHKGISLLAIAGKIFAIIKIDYKPI